MVTYLWTPKARHCMRITKDKAQYKTGMYHRNFKLAGGKKIKRTIRHLVTDYAHILPKLHCPWDDKPKNEISHNLLYHGLKASDVTQRLRPPAPTHSAHLDFKDATSEWHGRQAQDVTELYTYMSRGHRPPSRDYWYGREATDISDHLRIIPPIATEGEAQDFYGRPKSDVTDYNIFPACIPETESRSEAARPLGKCPPGSMADYVPLVRDKHGRLVRPQPKSPPKSPSKRHDQKNQEFLKLGGGGILSQIVPGHSRSEAKRPLGKYPPGVMADYNELKWDEQGKLIHPPCKFIKAELVNRKLNDSSPPTDPAAERAMRHSNERLHPLGKVPEGVMADFQHVDQSIHKHTTDGLWSLPTMWTKDSAKLISDQISPSKQTNLSLSHISQMEATCNVDETSQGMRQKLHIDPNLQLSKRVGKVYDMHDDIVHEPCMTNIKELKNGELEQDPCKIKSPRMSFVSERSKSPLSRSANASTKNCDPIKHDPRISRPSSTCGSSPRCDESARPETAHKKYDFPKESKTMKYNVLVGTKRDLSYAPSGHLGSGVITIGSTKDSCASRDNIGSKDCRTMEQNGWTMAKKPSYCASSRYPDSGGSIAGSARGSFTSRGSIGSKESRGNKIMENNAWALTKRPLPHAPSRCYESGGSIAGSAKGSCASKDSIRSKGSKENKTTEYNACIATKRPPFYAPSGQPGSGGSVVGSARGSVTSRSSVGSKGSKASDVKNGKKNRIISPVTTPEHYQFPYFGHSKTYVTDPAVSPNLTPPGRRSMRLPGQEKMPFAGIASVRSIIKPKFGLLEEPNLNPHILDGKTSWFGHAKSYVTNPAVSLTLTPSNWA